MADTGFKRGSGDRVNRCRRLSTLSSALGKPVEIFIYPNELHIKNQPKHRFEIYNRNLDWMRFWLQDYEDPNSSKSQQYARWRKLRELQVAP